MRQYKCMIILFTAFSIITFILGLIISHLNFSNSEFCTNTILGLFSGSFCALLTALVSYFYEKRKTLESFYEHTLYISNYINKYQANNSIDDKVKFFLNFLNLDFHSLNNDYGNIDFLFEIKTHNRCYIYQEIYEPIILFKDKVARYEFDFMYFMNSSEKNYLIIEKNLAELENSFLECGKNWTKPKLTRKINNQLDGKYYEIMYGKYRNQKVHK